MTRKDYVLLSDKLRYYWQFVLEETERSGFASCVGVLGSALKSDNPRFDSDKFVDAVIDK